MINIKYKILGEKNYRKKSIPTFDELTTKQYLEFKEFKTQDFISYIAMIFNIDRIQAAQLIIKMPESIQSLIGIEKNWELYKLDRQYFLGYEIKEIEALGQRYCYIRNINGYPGFKMYVFILAIALSGCDDIPIIKKIYNKLLKENYYEVMGLGFFLQRSFEIGIIKEQPILKRLLLLMKMQILKIEQVLTNLMNGQYTMKYRHFVNYSI